MKNILALALSFLSFFASAQDINHAVSDQIGISATGLIYGRSYKIILAPHWAVRKKSHAVSIGPTILLTSEFDASDRKYPKLTGFRGRYLYFPFAASRTVDFYFHTTLVAQRIVDAYNVNYWNSDHSKYENVGYKNIEVILNPILGYEIKLKVWKGLSLHQSVGAGYFFSAIDGDEKGNPDHVEINPDYRPYGTKGFSLEAELGMAYLLDRR